MNISQLTVSITPYSKFMMNGGYLKWLRVEVDCQGEHPFMREVPITGQMSSFTSEFEFLMERTKEVMLDEIRRFEQMQNVKMFEDADKKIEIAPERSL